MIAIPSEAVTAAAEFIHDDECGVETTTCRRWQCGSDPASQFHSSHAPHVEFYRQKAQAILKAAVPLITAAVVTAERERMGAVQIQAKIMTHDTWRIVAQAQGRTTAFPQHKVITLAEVAAEFADLLAGDST